MSADREPYIVAGGREHLDAIEPIWRSLFEHHLTVDHPEFAAIRGERQTWSDRRRGFQRILDRSGFVFLADLDGRMVGYVIVDVVDGATTGGSPATGTPTSRASRFSRRRGAPAWGVR